MEVHCALFTVQCALFTVHNGGGGGALCSDLQLDWDSGLTGGGGVVAVKFISPTCLLSTVYFSVQLITQNFSPQCMHTNLIFKVYF